MRDDRIGTGWLTSCSRKQPLCASRTTSATAWSVSGDCTSRWVRASLHPASTSPRLTEPVSVKSSSVRHVAAVMVTLRMCAYRASWDSSQNPMASAAYPRGGGHSLLPPTVGGSSAYTTWVP